MCILRKGQRPALKMAHNRSKGWQQPETDATVQSYKKVFKGQCSFTAEGFFSKAPGRFLSGWGIGEGFLETP
jgi:hypothetical protein